MLCCMKACRSGLQSQHPQSVGLGEKPGLHQESQDGQNNIVRSYHKLIITIMVMIYYSATTTTNKGFLVYKF